MASGRVPKTQRTFFIEYIPNSLQPCSVFHKGVILLKYTTNVTPNRDFLTFY